MSAQETKDNYYHPQQKLDDELQRELDDALGGMSLEEIMDAEEQATRQEAPAGASTAPGVRRGKVIAIQGDDIFVDLGGRSEGCLAGEQFADEPLPSVGDTIEVVIEGYNNAEGLLVLSRQGAVLAAAWETLEEGQVVEGRVTAHNKGGLELDIQGIKAFMPVSQIERFRVDDLTQYVDQRLQCQVTEVDRDEHNVIVSRRDLLEAEAAEAAKELRKSLAEGKVVEGVVRSIMPYGAFVDLGGVDGLLHVSDMSFSRVENPSDIVKEGDKVKVMVLKIDTEKDRISLGLKQTLPDPWDGVEGKWPVDSMVTARVTRLADFGAFAELEEGVEGLIPISEMSFERRIKHPSEVTAEGDMVRLRVLKVDPEAHRISLSLKQAGEDPWLGASVRWPEGSVVDGVVTRIADFGAFVQLTPGVDGLVHISELSDSHIRSVSEAVREGEQVKAKVLEVDEERRRIALSIKQAVLMGESFVEDEPAAELPQVPSKRKKPLKGGLD